jgi:hypothetical protein
VVFYCRVAALFNRPSPLFFAFDTYQFLVVGVNLRALRTLDRLDQLDDSYRVIIDKEVNESLYPEGLATHT